MRFLHQLNSIFVTWSARIEKRTRLVISAIILTFSLLVATFFRFDQTLIFTPLLFLLTYFLTYFALLEEIEKIEWFSLFLMPIALTLAFYFFYFLVPVRWLTRLPFIIIYAISIYALLLTANIFNVRVEKSLQLYRAAFSVNFFYQLLVLFLFFNITFSYHPNFIINWLIVTGMCTIMALQLYWGLVTKIEIDRDLFKYALLTGIAIGQLALVLSFVPVKGTVMASFLSASYYCLGAVIYSYLDQRLFTETIREYLFVWGFVLAITLLSLSWQ